ncbi:MAG: hypothetical protein DWQ10_00490, partial [Calditrichaeota bacterium]
VLLNAQQRNATKRTKENIEKHWTRIVNSYAHNLDTENDGIIESSLVCVLQLKVNFPYKNMAQLQDKVDELVLGGQTENVRYKAFLVATFLKKAEWLQDFEYLHNIRENVYEQNVPVFDDLTKVMLAKVIRKGKTSVAAQ